MRRLLSSSLHPLHIGCRTFVKGSAVQVVSFDAMDTIITVDEPINKVYARIASNYGIAVDPTAIASCFPKYFKDLSDSHPCFGFHSIGHFEWWRRVVVGCLEEGCSAPIDRETGDKIAQYLFDFYATASPWRIIDPKLKPILKLLRQNGLGVVAVSNFDGRLKKILRHLDLYPLFDMILASGEVGVEKPNPRIFEMVVDRYRLSNASQMLHIGDNVKKDYQAALDFGAQALLFDPLSHNQDVLSTHKITSISDLRINSVL